MLKSKLEETAHKSPPKEYREEGAADRGDYADPKRYKYPLHTEKNVRAAISYFAQPDNHGMYSPEERKSIARKIFNAARKYNIEVSDDWKEKFNLSKAMGQDGEREQTGGTGFCVCPKCGHRAKHDRGKPCNTLTCPECGVALTGEGTAGSKLKKSKVIKTRVILTRDGKMLMKSRTGKKENPAITVITKMVNEYEINGGDPAVAIESIRNVVNSHKDRLPNLSKVLEDEFGSRTLKAKDTSRLIKKQIINKQGKKQTVYVRPGEDPQKQVQGQQQPGVQQARKDSDTAKEEKKKSKRDMFKNAIKNLIETMTQVFSGQGGTEQATGTAQQAGEDASRVGIAQRKEKTAKKREKQAEKKTEKKSGKDYYTGTLFEL